jgi:ferredoxin
MNATIDKQRCVGHAMCNARGPLVYGLDDLGYGVIIEGPVDETHERQARDGADACPERAITIA